jgi:hypothetical protein
METEKHTTEKENVARSNLVNGFLLFAAIVVHIHFAVL